MCYFIKNKMEKINVISSKGGFYIVFAYVS